MEESKEFIKYIDSEIEKQDDYNIERLKAEEEKERLLCTDLIYDLRFVHVAVRTVVLLSFNFTLLTFN